jgi:hypothetical protein
MTPQPSRNPSREQMRIAEEEGKLPPGKKRRLPAEAQDSTLREDAFSTGHHDAEKVPGDAGGGAPDPAARGRDAPVDLR